MSNCSIEILVATDEESKKAAAGLVNLKYEKIGNPEERKGSHSPLELMQQDRTTTFVLFGNKIPVGTISVIRDVPGEKLPYEEDFPEEVSSAREKVGQLAVVGQFAVSEELSGLCYSSTVGCLYAKVFMHSLSNHISGLICVVNPGDPKEPRKNKKHFKIYERMGFCKDGEIKMCKTVGALGVFMLANLPEIVGSLSGINGSQKTRNDKRLAAKVINQADSLSGTNLE